MIIIPYADEFQEEWDKFISESSENGTIFHLQKFLSYHPKNKFNDSSIIIKDQTNTIISVFMSAIVNNTILSHPGSTYGGIIIKKYLKLQEIEKLCKAIFIYYLKKFPNYEFKIILSENFFLTNDKIEFFLNTFGLKLSSKEISTVVNVRDYFNYKGMRKSTRQYISSRRFDKLDIEYKIANNELEIKNAYTLVENNLKNKYNKDATHTYEELILLKTLFKEKITFFIAKRNNEVLTTYITFELNNDVLHIFYIATSNDIENITSIGMVNFILEYSKNKYTYVNFGISSREKEIKYWIHNYKEQFSKLFLTKNIWTIQNLNEARI